MFGSHRLSRLALACALALSGFGLGCGDAPEPAARPDRPGPLDGGKAVIRMERGGEIHLRFFPDKAPGHVKNFLKLTRAHHYDGTTFHRVIPGFMIQGGDHLSKDAEPANDGMGTLAYSIPAEFNAVPHRRGIVAMARREDPDSAAAQFYIMVEDNPRWRSILDGKYTVFGEVIRGMDVADRIVAVPRDVRDRPLENQVIASITIEPLGPNESKR